MYTVITFMRKDKEKLYYIRRKYFILFSSTASVYNAFIKTFKKS